MVLSSHFVEIAYFFTLVHILISECLPGTIVSITVPALYSKYEEDVDCCAGLVHEKFSRRYRIVDENVIRRLPRHFSEKKDS